MQWTSHQIWAPRISAFGVALLLGAGVSYWVLHWPAASMTPVASTAQAELPQADVNSLTRLLGAPTGTAQETVAPAVNRFNLIGVVARSAGAGSAIIAVDGKPAKSYAVGSTIEAGLVLKAVAPRKAMLAASMDAASVQTLELPAPATGK
jgi:general secretion pathway protein C